MNMKAIALLMSLAMVFAATAVVLVDDAAAQDNIEDGTDSKPFTKGPVYVKVGYNTTVDFVITQPSSTEGHFVNTVDWTAGNAGNPNLMDDSIPGDGYTDDGLKITIVNGTLNDDTTATYRLTIDAKEASSGTFKDIPLKYEIITKTSAGDEYGVEQEIYYVLKVVVVGNPFTSTSELSLKFTDGQYYSEAPILNELDTTNYTYYAVGLPKGVQMTPDGDVSGTPIDSNANGTTAKIVATHKASNLTFVADCSITVNEQTNEFDYTVPAATQVSTDESKYIIVQGTEVTLKTTIGGSAANITAVYYYAMNVAGEQTPVGPVSGSIGDYELSINGSGSYRVVMVNGDVVKSFELVVVAITYDVSPGIGFSPGTAPST